MAKRSQLQLLCESFLALVASVILPRLPRACIVRLARGLGSLAFRFSSRDRSIAMANLDAVYGETAGREARERIVVQSFQTMALLILDLFWFSVDSERRLKRHVHFDKKTKAFFRGEVRRIVLAAHFGNWEALGQAYSLAFTPMSSVAAPLKNPFVDNMLRRLRETTGQRVIPQKGALRRLLRALEAKQAVALLIDQNTLPADGGVFVEFFGLPVPVSRTVASLFCKVRPELAFAYSIVDEHGDYQASVCNFPEHLKQSESVEEVTQAMMGMMEKTIRAYPGNWLWMYKRWKYIPAGRSAEGYPCYSRPIEPAEMKGIT